MNRERERQAESASKTAATGSRQHRWQPTWRMIVINFLLCTSTSGTCFLQYAISVSSNDIKRQAAASRHGQMSLALSSSQPSLPSCLIQVLPYQCRLCLSCACFSYSCTSFLIYRVYTSSVYDYV